MGYWDPLQGLIECWLGSFFQRYGTSTANRPYLFVIIMGGGGGGGSVLVCHPLWIRTCTVFTMPYSSIRCCHYYRRKCTIIEICTNLYMFHMLYMSRDCRSWSTYFEFPGFQLSGVICLNIKCEGQIAWSMLCFTWVPVAASRPRRQITLKRRMTSHWRYTTSCRRHVPAEGLRRTIAALYLCPPPQDFGIIALSSNEDSGESVHMHMHRLAGVFVARNHRV